MTAGALRKLGNLHRLAGELEEALPCLERGLAIHLETLGPALDGLA